MGGAGKGYMYWIKSGTTKGVGYPSSKNSNERLHGTDVVGEGGKVHEALARLAVQLVRLAATAHPERQHQQAREN